jgi:hypothetical protein
VSSWQVWFFWLELNKYSIFNMQNEWRKNKSKESRFTHMQSFCIQITVRTYADFSESAKYKKVIFLSTYQNLRLACISLHQSWFFLTLNKNRFALLWELRKWLSDNITLHTQIHCIHPSENVWRLSRDFSFF